ncbi:MAG: hypothetical protein HRU20_31960, partial [Pseudomonadales bacterium]|nr:hypothetical protein [Pseudomonadales bacterium]
MAAKKLTRIAPFYSVSMGQAVMTPNLGKASLVTGVTPDDRLLSCSAIVLHNNQTGATGLYHFPAGNIHEDRDAQQILTRMRDEVAPT